MKKHLLWIIPVVLIVTYLAIQWSRSDYLEFDRQREAWHRRCDAYVGKSVSGADRTAADACARELNELDAYAQRKGWHP
jgi:hypothetical protein